MYRIGLSSNLIPVEGDIERCLEKQKQKVMLMLNLVLMVDPWEQVGGKSGFVQPALESYLLLI